MPEAMLPFAPNVATTRPSVGHAQVGAAAAGGDERGWGALARVEGRAAAGDAGRVAAVFVAVGGRAAVAGGRAAPAGGRVAVAGGFDATGVTGGAAVGAGGAT